MKYSHEELRLYTELYTSTCMRVGGEYEGCGGYVYWTFRTWYWNIRQYHVQVTYTHAHITVTYTHAHTTVTYTHTHTTYIHTCTHHCYIHTSLLLNTSHTHMDTPLTYTHTHITVTYTHHTHHCYIHTSLTYTHAHITAHKMHSHMYRLYVHIWVGTSTANRFSRIAWVW